MMGRRSGLSCMMALLMAGLFLGACVVSLAEAGLHSTTACGPRTAGEIASSKAPTVGLPADALPTLFLALPRLDFTRFLPPLSVPLRSGPRWTDVASRAPPLG